MLAKTQHPTYVHLYKIENYRTFEPASIHDQYHPMKKQLSQQSLNATTIDHSIASDEA